MPSKEGKTKKRFLEHSEELTLAASIANTQEEKSKSKVDNVKHQMPLESVERTKRHRHSAGRSSKLAEAKAKLAHERAQRKKGKTHAKRRAVNWKANDEQSALPVGLPAPSAKRRVAFA
ncbi:hypothetical protein VNI00_009794 [Paramarasmius palmivorus]|uniref:Uncharacterized protein n=1 Tax=Paramarasmius palmivorus TaxID=297713 RepID=A0AAW0CMV0_9AGAR